MRCAIYARVSSAQQRDAQTIESQLRILPEFVRSRGWTQTGTYIDDGRSAKAGKLAKRTGFSARVASGAEKLAPQPASAAADRHSDPEQH